MDKFYNWIYINYDIIFPKWFLESEKCLQIIDAAKKYAGSLNADAKAKKLTIDRVGELSSQNAKFAGASLVDLYTNVILEYYSVGWPISLQKYKFRNIWLFYILNTDRCHEYHQSIIDDIIKCPFEIDWNIPVNDFFTQREISKKRDVSKRNKPLCLSIKERTSRKVITLCYRHDRIGDTNILD